MGCVADVLQSQGRDAEAVQTGTAKVHKAALSHATTSGDKVGTATSIAGLATAYTAQGRLAEAERLGLYNLKLREEVAKDHPDVASSLGILADIWRQQHRRSESIEAIARAVDIQRDALSENEPELGASLNNLGYLLMEDQRLPESI